MGCRNRRVRGEGRSRLRPNSSKIIFGIPPTRAYSAATNTYAPESRRQADVYVFCHLKHKVQETLNPLDLDQWDFYVLPSRMLDEKMGKRQTITLKQLRELEAANCGYGKLRETVEKGSCHQSGK